jgi:hypothetical protein
MLSDVAEPPLAPLDFGEHPGLLLLYAERLAANDRAAWRPVRPGPTWDYYELVIEEQGREKAKARETMVQVGRGAHLG